MPAQKKGKTAQARKGPTPARVPHTFNRLRTALAALPKETI